MHFKRSSRVFILVVASALMAVALPSVASAQTYVCVAKGGQMRYLGTAPGTCLKGETLVVLAAQGPVGPAGPPADPSFGPRLTSLESNNRWQIVSIDVNCATPGSLSAALAQAAAYASANIYVTGVCSQTDGVLIRNNNTHIYGNGSGAGFSRPTDAPGPVVEVAATGVRLDNLTLTGGNFGLVVNAGASVQVSNTTVTASTNHGIIVSGQLTLNDSTVTGAGGTGVMAQAGGIVFMNNSSILNGHTDGLLLQASRGFVNGSVISGNRQGIQLYNGASVDLGGGTRISGSVGGDGVSVMGGSSVHINGWTEVTGNSGNGIFLLDTSVITVWGGPDTKITGNGAWGVFCDSTGRSVAQISGNIAGVVVTPNGTGSISCPALPR